MVEVMRELDRAIERIMGVEIEQMGGDNLAVLLCSHFDDPDDGSEECDNGWSQTATDAYEEIKQEITGLFVPVREALSTLTTENAALAARVDALENHADMLAQLLTRACGDISALLIFGSREGDIRPWTAEYTQAVNVHDAHFAPRAALAGDPS